MNYSKPATIMYAVPCLRGCGFHMSSEMTRFFFIQ